MTPVYCIYFTVAQTLFSAVHMFCVSAAHLLVYNHVLFAHEYYTAQSIM